MYYIRMNLAEETFRPKLLMHILYHLIGSGFRLSIRPSCNLPSVTVASGFRP